MLRDTDWDDGVVPRPGDFARLRPSNTISADPHETFILADYIDPYGNDATSDEEHWVIYRPTEHPQYEDWASAVPASDIAQLTRVTVSGPRTWTLASPETTS